MRPDWLWPKRNQAKVQQKLCLQWPALELLQLKEAVGKFYLSLYCDLSCFALYAYPMHVDGMGIRLIKVIAINLISCIRSIYI